MSHGVSSWRLWLSFGFLVVAIVRLWLYARGRR